jgi:hypothetical protein
MSLRQTIDELIADHQTRRLPVATPRLVQVARLPGKADVVVGMRRSGKTYLLYQELAALQARGIPRERTLFINFEDERLQPLASTDLHLVTDAFYARYPELRDEECWFFLDEIQNVSGWERFVRRLVETENTRVMITGSSAKLLAKEIATSLRGRSLSTEILPFSFAEALAHAGIGTPPRWPPPARTRSLLEHHFRRYLARGGFPEVQTLADEHRVAVLQEYVDVVLFRDIVERHQVANTAALRHLVRRLLRSPAALFSVHKLHGEMKSAGIALGKDDLHEFISYLEDAFLLFPVGIDAHSEKRRLVNPRKNYLIDHALSQALRSPHSEDTGHHLENLIYLELRRRGHRPRYGVTRAGGEVDFVVRQARPELIQVTATLASPEVRRREFGALADAMAEHGVRTGLVITLAEEETHKVPGGTIRVVPAWRWLLDR